MFKIWRQCDDFVSVSELRCRGGAVCGGSWWGGDWGAAGSVNPHLSAVTVFRGEIDLSCGQETSKACSI